MRRETQQFTWEPCRPGTITQIVRDQVDRERRRFLKRAALASVLVVGGAAALALNIGEFPTFSRPLAPIVCADVHTHLEGYVLNDLNDPLLVNQIFHHLQKCRACQLVHSEVRVQCGLPPEPILDNGCG